MCVYPLLPWGKSKAWTVINSANHLTINYVIWPWDICDPEAFVIAQFVQKVQWFFQAWKLGRFPKTKKISFGKPAYRTLHSVQLHSGGVSRGRVLGCGYGCLRCCGCVCGCGSWFYWFQCFYPRPSRGLVVSCMQDIFSPFLDLYWTDKFGPFKLNCVLSHQTPRYSRSLYVNTCGDWVVWRVQATTVAPRL